MLYPLCWALSEGSNVISPTSEMVWYGVLDLLLGPFYLFFLIFSLRNVDYGAFGLQSWKYSDTYGTGVGSGSGNAGAAPATTGTGGVRSAKAAEAGIPAHETAPAATAPAAAAPAAEGPGAANVV